MEMEFTKLSEVPVTDNPTDEASVLIEEAGEIKRTPKSAIGDQADWNETDETKPSFILNKPEKLGGVAKYFITYTDSMLVETDDEWTVPTDTTVTNAVTMDEFKKKYFDGGCILGKLDSANKDVGEYGSVIYFMPYNGNTTANISLGNYGNIGGIQINFPSE